MKRSLMQVLIGCAVLFFATSALALPIAGTNVTMEKDWTVPYTMTDSQGLQYQTFCLEKENFFQPGTSYYVSSVGDFASGGGGGADDGFDEVSTETKWLYAAYIQGVFAEVDDAALKVQNAIWFLEYEDRGETALDDWNYLSGFEFDDRGWKVVAVNLLAKDNAGIIDIQSQLVGAPVPEPATMLLLGTGLIGLAGLGRMRRKKK